MSRDKNDALTTLSRKEVLEVLAERKDLSEIDMRKANLIKETFQAVSL